jgi:hypothetical protein
MTKTAVYSAAIEVFSANGKKVTSWVLPALSQPGTYTFEFEPGAAIPAGKYVCRLMTDGAAIAMQSITLF